MVAIYPILNSLYGVGMRYYSKQQEVILANMTACLVAIEFGLSTDDLFMPTKGSASLSFARQTAMYLTAVVFNVSMAGVGRAFGRDPSTISHACQIIEDARDDAVFDLRLSAIENALMATRQLKALQPG